MGEKESRSSFSRDSARDGSRRRETPENAPWTCLRCNKEFHRQRQAHSCVVVSLDDHFRARPHARRLFRAFCRKVEQARGPFRLSVAKTRIGLIDRITFAAVMPRKRFLRAHVLLTKPVASSRFLHVEHMAPYWVCVFEIRSEEDLDSELGAWMADAAKGRGCSD